MEFLPLKRIWFMWTNGIKFYVMGSSFSVVSDKYVVKCDLEIVSISVHATHPVITTRKPHGLWVGDSVVLSSTDSTPAVDGTETVVEVINEKSFTVAAATTVAGATGHALVSTHDMILTSLVGAILSDGTEDGSGSGQPRIG